MKKVILTLLPGFMLAVAATAQSLAPKVVATAGNFVTNGNYSLSYTIGEPVITMATQTGYILTQGFQQNELSGSEVQEISFDDLSVKIYPNPAVNYVNVLITTSKNNTAMRVQLYDVLGRNVNVPVANQYDGNQRLFTLNLSGLAEAMYFVSIYDSENNIHTFKINKITP